MNTHAFIFRNRKKMNRKIKITKIGLVSAMILASILASISIVSAATIFEDNFEIYDVGTFPSSGGWQIASNGAGNQYQTIVNTTSVSEKKSFQVLGEYGRSAVIKRPFTTDSEIIGYEGYIRAESRNVGGNTTSIEGSIGFFNQSACGYYAVIGLGSDGIIYAGDSWNAFKYALQPYDPNTWYKVKVILNKTSNNYNVWINDIFKKENLKTNNAHEISSLEVSSAWECNKFYYDDIKIFTTDLFTTTTWKMPTIDNMEFSIDDLIEPNTLHVIDGGAHTVHVYNGTYTEDITVNKYITLEGKDNTNTFTVSGFNVTANDDDTLPTLDWPMFQHDLHRTGFLNASSSYYVPYAELLWKYDTNGTTGNPAVSDINEDGEMEIILGVGGTVNCINSSGDLIWSYYAGGNQNIDESSPTISDINNDGKLEILVGFDESGAISDPHRKLYCLNNTGGLIWSYGSPGWSSLSSPAVADINNDNNLEIFKAFGNFRLSCISSTGSLIWESSATPGWSSHSTPAVADINVDTKPEVFIGGGGGLICINSTTGSNIWTYPTGGSHGDNVPTIGDLNNDSELEILVGSSYSNYGLYCIDSTGSLNWNYLTNSPVSSSPAIADLNNDGYLEIVFGCDNGKIYCLNKTGNELWSYQTGGSIKSSPAICDVNGDGDLEVIVGSGDGSIYCLNSTGGKFWRYIICQESIRSSPAIADINKDGLLDIIVTSRNGLYALTGSLYPPTETTLYVNNLTLPSVAPLNKKFFVSAKIRNIGNAMAKNVTATLNIPTNFTSYTPLTKVVDNITSGDSIIVSWSVSANATGNYTLWANISASNANAISAIGNVSVILWKEAWNTIQVTIDVTNDMYPVIAIDKNNVAHIAWITDSNLYYTNSSSGWNKVQIASETVEFRAPSISIDNNNVVYIAWTDNRNKWLSSDGTAQGYDVYFGKSSDGWIHHLTTGSTNLRCSNPQMAVDHTGNVHIVYERHTKSTYPYKYRIFYVNQSSEWAEQQVSDYPFPGVGNGVHGPTVGVDSNCIVHAAYYTGDQIDHIRYANSSTGWNNVQIDKDCTGNWWDDRTNPSITVDSNNIIHIGWVDGRNTALPGDPAYHGGLPNRKEIYYANSSGGWINIEIALPEDTIGPAIKWKPSIVVENSSLVHVAWLHRTSDRDFYPDFYYSNSNKWSNATHITDFENITSVYVGSTQNDLAVDNDGIVHVTWHDNRDGNHNIYYANSLIDTTSPTITFAPPTPANNTEVNVDYVFVNVTLNENGNTAKLNWNGVNETMLGAGMNFYLNKTGLSNGIYSFKVYANDIADNWNVSETRVVTINVAPTPPAEVPALTPLGFIVLLISLLLVSAIAIRKMYKR